MTDRDETLDRLLTDGTQIALAYAFLHVNPHLRFVAKDEGGEWHEYDGARYAPLPRAVAESRLQTLILATNEASQNGVPCDDAMKALAGPQALGIVARAARLTPSRPDDYDHNPGQLVFSDMTVDLQTGRASANSPDNLVTRAALIAYPRDVGAPAHAAWRAFLSEVCAWDDDEQRFVQRLLGASLCGSGQAKAFAYLYGESNTGKSTFMALLARTFGQARAGGYVCKLPSRTFMSAGRGAADRGHTDELEHLPGSRLCWCDEVAAGATLDEDRIKNLTNGTGESVVRVSRKGEKGRDHDVGFLLWFSAEHLVRLKAADGGIFNRQMILCTERVIPEPRDPRWVERNWPLLAPAIAAWGLEGAKDYLAYGLGDEPTSVQEARAEHRQETGLAKVLLQVLEVVLPAEGCEPLETPFADIRAAVRKWWDLKGRGEFPSDRALHLELTSIGCPSKREAGLTKSKKSPTRLHARLKGLDSSGRTTMGNN